MRQTWIRDLVFPDDTPADWQRRRASIARRIAAMLGEMPDPIDPAPERIDERRQNGLIRRSLRYHVEPDESVEAVLLIPEQHRQPGPAILVPHGTSKAGKLSALGETEPARGAYALELAQRGYVTMAVDAIAMGERLLPGAEYLDTAPFYARFPERTIEGKNLWDHQRALDVLAAQPEVDATRLGCIGHSQGGRATHYLAAFDDRVASAVMSCGVTPHASNYRLFQSRNRYDAMPTVRRHVEQHGALPFEKHELSSLVAPRPLLFISPTNDPYNLRTDQIGEMAHRLADLYALLGKSEHLGRFMHGHGHNTIPYVREIMYGWMDLHLRQT